MKTTKIFQVDAFTEKAFKGNPAGVCLLPEQADSEWMQAVAEEMNLAETAFVWKKGSKFGLKWFSPEMEVKLCGHATLATTWILYKEKIIPENKPVLFETLSGILECQVNDEVITMNFPAIYTSPDNTIVLPDSLSEKPVAIESNQEGYAILELKSAEDVLKLQPDFEKLKKSGSSIFIFTAPADRDFDFVSRVFAPAFGINEDSVTGSAHCALTTYWNKKTGKSSFKAYQASRRGGIVETSLSDTRVLLKGKAITVIEGILYS